MPDMAMVTYLMTRLDGDRSLTLTLDWVPLLYGLLISLTTAVKLSFLM